MTTEINHDLDQHQETCQETHVLRLTVERKPDGTHEVEAETHLHGTAEIRMVCELLTDVRSRVALAMVEAMTEQAIRRADPAELGPMLEMLMDAISDDEAPPAPQRAEFDGRGGAKWTTAGE